MDLIIMLALAVAFGYAARAAHAALAAHVAAQMAPVY